VTEAELLAVSHESWSNAISLVALFVSILSGYLIVAYMVGKNMTRSQIVILNTLFLGLSGFFVLGALEFARISLEMEYLALEIGTQRIVEPQAYLPYGLTMFYGICIIAALRFMWDVRHPKPE
jgi:hypothetical protein